MKKEGHFSEFAPREDGQDDIEILEIVGIEAGPGASGAPEQPRQPGPDSTDAEYVLDFDHPEGGMLVSTAPATPASRGGPAADAEGEDTDRERLMRLRADYDNLRKRIDREREEFESTANGALMARLLPVLDNLERALAVDTRAGGEGALREGLVMIQRQLCEQMRKEGLTPIEAVGRAFDPNLHDAVATALAPHLPANTVLEEFRRGYLFHDRVLRPASVKVSIDGERADDELG